jgi:NAD(P)H-hydrate epimerase
MKIFTDEQIKSADRHTIENEPVSSIDLMERAAEEISQWIADRCNLRQTLVFVVGKGNNGGDGLAAARILAGRGFKCRVCAVFAPEAMSGECATNFRRLPADVEITDSLDDIAPDDIIIDALLGAGVSGDVKQPVAAMIDAINRLPNEVISIDLPSGMKTGFGNAHQTIVKADITLTLQFPKLALLLPEAGECAGEIYILPIGLDAQYLQQTATPYYFIDERLTGSIWLRRPKFAYKNACGHALLVCGQRGMMGAATLAVKAALRSGCGLVTAHVPADERMVIHIACPSALVSCDDDADCFTDLPADLSQYTATGVGCGLGTSSATVRALKLLLKRASSPVVIDADALNLLAAKPELLSLTPKNSILTPHLGELRRLTGDWCDEHDKHERVARLATQLSSVVVVKGAHTAIFDPNGRVYFNSTGNAGMAKGGCGDVLTGLLTGLLARGYSSLQAAIIGVYFHGLAGDKAESRYGKESMNSADLIDEISI